MKFSQFRQFAVNSYECHISVKSRLYHLGISRVLQHDSMAPLHQQENHFQPHFFYKHVCWQMHYISILISVYLHALLVENSTGCSKINSSSSNKSQFNKLLSHTATGKAPLQIGRYFQDERI